MALLEVNNLSYHVGERRIIDGISLAINAGEVHSLFNTNGTGKSTLACKGREDHR
jgi:Fe-S cluster assembly ATPase SufC